MDLRKGLCKFLVGKRKRKRPRERTSCKWELKIKTDIIEICGREWNALIWMCENEI
jgi:hypothetical protein